MKMVKIEPVPRPASFNDVKFLEADWAKASKSGPLTVPYGTAMENIRLSKGLYRIKPEVKEVEIEVKGPKPVEEMSNKELFAEMHSFGKPPRKQMTRTAAQEFVTKLREDAAKLIVDEEA